MTQESFLLDAAGERQRASPPTLKETPRLEEEESRVTQEQRGMQGFFRVMHAKCRVSIWQILLELGVGSRIKAAPLDLDTKCC